MQINCPRSGCNGVLPDGVNTCPVCKTDIRQAISERLAAKHTEPGSKAWWLGGDGLKFVFQLVGVLFLVTALVVIVVLFFQSSNDKVKLSEFTTTQGLIAGVLLAAIAAAVIVAVMTVLFGSGDETLKDRTQMVRDIIAPILAIFGTITGFYFGAKTVEERGKTNVTAGADINAKTPDPKTEGK